MPSPLRGDESNLLGELLTDHTGADHEAEGTTFAHYYYTWKYPFVVKLQLLAPTGNMLIAPLRGLVALLLQSGAMVAA